ncbi:ectoine/hydroxyectoine ABC transporter permease subunit EhuC [Spiractinospora alimapuensis]|nr:ectoine/hydroxyectoine ABC transporter permease subunit EhuC [Spiractinospora alimapuensis]
MWAQTAWDWAVGAVEFIGTRFPSYLEGAKFTVLATLGGAALGFVLAMVIGIAGTTRSRALRAVATVYTETFRGVSALVLMFWAAFAIPNVTSFTFEPLTAGIVALGVNIGAYGAEVVRAAINAVPRSQVEATIALNMTWTRRMWSVILPQAWAQMLPTFGNLVIELMKATAVISLIGVTDIMWSADLARSSTFETVYAYGWALVMYFVFAQILVFLMRLLERHANRRLGRASGTGFWSLLRPPSITTAGGAR